MKLTLLISLVTHATNQTGLWGTSLSMTAFLLLSGIKKDGWFKKLVTRWMLKRMQKKKPISKDLLGLLGLLALLLIVGGPILLILVTGSSVPVIGGIMTIAGILLLIIWGTIKSKRKRENMY